MKLDARRVEAFLADPGASRVVLLYGDDVGLIAERAGRLVRAVAGEDDDAFRITELTREDHDRIPGEMAALSLIGGRRVVRVRDATDMLAKSVAAALTGKGDALLVIEAAGLPSRAKLRGLVEQAADGVAIGCYPLAGRALEASVQAALTALGAEIEPDALTWLAGQLGADRAVTQRELEKLALYAGQDGCISVGDVHRCIGDLAGLSLEDALFAACEGDIAATDRALELAMAEGTAPVTALRGCLSHLQRLQRVKGAMAQGVGAGDAMKALRPPIFFQRQGSFSAALRLWSNEALQAGCVRLWEAERACKRTGAPAEMLSRSAILGVAQRAAAARRRM
jgi:DNA polymerase-3 subunit delta